MKEECKKSNPKKNLVLGIVIGFVVGALAYSQKEKIIKGTVKGFEYVNKGIKSVVSSLIKKDDATNVINN